MELAIALSLIDVGQLRLAHVRLRLAQGGKGGKQAISSSSGGKGGKEPKVVPEGGS